jgi:hypothetical protein
LDVTHTLISLKMNNENEDPTYRGYFISPIRVNGSAIDSVLAALSKLVEGTCHL